MTDSPTLGNSLRGARLGFGWSPEVRAYVRVSPDCEHIRVQVCPPGTLPKRVQGVHWQWYTVEARRRDPFTPRDLGETVRAIIAGRALVKRVKRPIEFTMDDEGKLVRST